MKPALVLQHLVSDGPSHLATWLARQARPMDRRCTEAGDAYPADLSGHAALAILGGAMSANDPLPSLRQAEALVREAAARGIPVIGHCLGGQLIARALGAPVFTSPRPEVGWHPVTWAPAAEAWFGPSVREPVPPLVFQWHFEAFGLPEGAVPLASGTACEHQAFAIGERLLAMQFHVELDAPKLEAWIEAVDPDYDAARLIDPAQVHDAAAMRHEAAARLRAQQRLADAAYARWWAMASAG